MSTEEIWAIGVFEGEGTISLLPHANSACISVSMTDLDVLERLKNVWGGKIYPRKSQNPRWKPAWRWYLGGKHTIAELLTRILPLLGERRACKALDALDRIDGVYPDYGT